MLGYTDADELLAKSVFDLTLPEDHERVQADIETALERTGAVRKWRWQYTLLREGGERFSAEVSASVLSDPDCQPVELVLVARDITDRKWGEDLLRIQRDCGTLLSTTSDISAAAEHLLKLALQGEGIDCGAVYIADIVTGAMNLVAQRGSSRFAMPAPQGVADSVQAPLAGPGPARSRRHIGRRRR